MAAITSRRLLRHDRGWKEHYESLVASIAGQRELEEQDVEAFANDMIEMRACVSRLCSARRRTRLKPLTWEQSRSSVRLLRLTSFSME